MMPGKTKEASGDNTVDPTRSFWDHHGIGALDFECPGAKFVLIPMASMGFGAMLNTQVLSGIMIAMRTHRIPVFTSQQSFFLCQKKKRDPATGKYKKTWLLAPSHCAHRDPQC